MYSGRNYGGIYAGAYAGEGIYAGGGSGRRPVRKVVHKGGRYNHDGTKYCVRSSIVAGPDGSARVRCADWQEGIDPRQRPISLAQHDRLAAMRSSPAFLAWKTLVRRNKENREAGFEHLDMDGLKKAHRQAYPLRDGVKPRGPKQHMVDFGNNDYGSYTSGQNDFRRVFIAPRGKNAKGRQLPPGAYYEHLHPAFPHGTVIPRS